MLIQSLAHYFAVDVDQDLNREGPDARDASVPAEHLRHEEGVRELLSKQPPDMVHEEQESVSGVMAAKVYGSFPVGVVFAASVFDLALPTDLSTVGVRFGAGHGLRFVLPRSELDAAPLLATRGSESTVDEGRTGHEAQAGGAPAFGDHMASLFEEHVQPVFEAIHLTTGADLRSMWSLLATNIKTMFLRVQMEPYRTHLELSQSRLEQLERDEAYIFAHGNAGPFSRRERNPLVQPTRRFTPPPELGEAMYLRTKCCLRYRIRVNGEHVPYCASCPKITDRERLEVLRRLQSDTTHDSSE